MNQNETKLIQYMVAMLQELCVKEGVPFVNHYNTIFGDDDES